MYNSNSHNRTTSGFSKELKKTNFKGGKVGNNKMTTKQYNLQDKLNQNRVTRNISNDQYMYN